MDTNIFEVLEFTSNHVYGSIVDITDRVNEIFPFINEISEDEFDRQKNLVERFLNGLQAPQYMSFNQTEGNISRTKEEFSNRKGWFDERHPLNALITLNGLHVINQEKFNNSIKWNSRWQALILLGAFIVSALSLWVAWLNYNATNNKSSQKQYLLPSKELIEQLKQKSTLPNTGTHHPTDEKNDSTKSN